MYNTRTALAEVETPLFFEFLLLYFPSIRRKRKIRRTSHNTSRSIKTTGTKRIGARSRNKKQPSENNDNNDNNNNDGAREEVRNTKNQNLKKKKRKRRGNKEDEEEEKRRPMLNTTNNE